MCGTLRKSTGVELPDRRKRGDRESEETDAHANSPTQSPKSLPAGIRGSTFKGVFILSRAI